MGSKGRASGNPVGKGPTQAEMSQAGGAAEADGVPEILSRLVSVVGPRAKPRARDAPDGTNSASRAQDDEVHSQNARCSGIGTRYEHRRVGQLSQSLQRAAGESRVDVVVVRPKRPVR